MSKSKNIDKIFEDVLNDDFVDVFKLNFFMRRAFGTLGVNMAYKFVTPQTNMYKMYSCVVWLVNFLCIVYTVVYCRTQFDALSTDIPLKVGMTLNAIVNVILVWKNLSSSNSSCQLYVKLQKIERSLKMKNAKRLNTKQYRLSIIWSVITVTLYVIWIIMFNNYMVRDFCPSATIASVISTASNAEIYHVYTVIKFILLRVQYVNNVLAQGKSRSQKEILFSTTDFTTISNDIIGDELVLGMCYILDGFADTMDIFQLGIFFFTFQMLAWQLITMQNLVVSFKNQMSVNLSSFLCTLPSSLVFMGLMLMLCFISQSLTTNLETCAELCTTLTTSLDEGKSRQNAKRITLLVRGKRDATVFNIFTLNTSLPLHLLAITASYTIVLLQFAAL